jgi:hypothetical protein
MSPHLASFKGSLYMLLTIILIAALAYAVVGVLLFVSQRRILFPATRTIYRTPADFGWKFEDVNLEVRGHQTHGWFIPAPGHPAGTVLFSHGNAGNIADRLESADIFRRMGLNVFVYDYGGYGKSTGRPSERRCYADATAAWEYLTETRGISPERVVLFGRSLGGAVTIDLASRITPAGVIAESTFTSTVDRAREMYPMFPVRWLLRHRFNSLDKMDKITAPLLLIHSREDTTIPFHHGQRLFDRAMGTKTFLEITGDHNEGFIITGPTYSEGLRTFIMQVLAPHRSGV